MNGFLVGVVVLPPKALPWNRHGFALNPPKYGRYFGNRMLGMGRVCAWVKF